MGKRLICCKADDEYLYGAGQLIGAVGSHDDVYLRITFGGIWAGMSKYVTFKDALGQNPTKVWLLPSLLVEDRPEVYDVPVPQSAKAVRGKMMVTVTGYSTDATGQTEQSLTNTVTAYFNVLEADAADGEDESVTLTLAQQVTALMNSLYAGEAVRVEHEALRETAEQARAAAEIVRATAEGERTQAETARAAAEQGRVSGESSRVTAEQARAAAEIVRATAEGGRAQAEAARTAAEAGRAAAEEQREAAGEGIVARAQAQADRASSALSAVESALDNIPPGEVPVIDDLTTGGGAAALSAGQGVALKEMIEEAVQGADPAGTAAEEVAAHNIAPAAHGDIRAQVEALEEGKLDAPTGALPGRMLLAGPGLMPKVGPWPSNPQLLRNWYFAAPINQRGKKEYPVSDQYYFIDCWRKGYWITARVEDNGLILETSTEYGGALGQFLDDPANINGAQVTFSMLIYTPTEAAFGLFTSDANMSTRRAIMPRTNYAPGTHLLTGTVTWEDLDKGVQLYLYTLNSICHPVAAKLELGDTQTLAHQEADGSWVLNDPPPDKALELSKCQRYQIPLPIWGG